MPWISLLTSLRHGTQWPSQRSAQHHKDVIVLFACLRVPMYVRYDGALLRYSLCRKQIETCYQCSLLRHRADLCPKPNDRLCRGYGVANPPQEHQCQPKCQLCSGNHQTADKACRACYKKPYLVKCCQWERIQQQEDFSSLPTTTTPNTETLFPPSIPDEEAVRGGATDPEEKPLEIPHSIAVPVKISEPHAWTCRATQSRDLNAPPTAWGYSYVFPKGRTLWLASQKEGLTLITNPSTPTRAGTSSTKESTSDVMFTRNTSATTWQNTFEDFGSSHYIIAIRVQGGPHNHTGRQLKMVDWTKFRKSGENQVQPIDDREH
ncbi:hypothetical protein HPB50_029328 [Hyalomma asiaticum]|nr:hypothetical protein HPB50_029328 [Hyalomma asiaticum]